MKRLIIAPCPKRKGTAPGKAGIGSLMLATYLWAVVMALGVWDYYILKFPPCHLPRVYQVSRGDPEELLQIRLRREVETPACRQAGILEEINR